MQPEYYFNKRINEYLEIEPNSKQTEVINKIAKTRKSFSSYYNLLDDFGYKIGITTLAIPVTYEKESHELGYKPFLKIYPRNIWMKRSQNLLLNEEILNAKKCGYLLAENLLDNLIDIDDLDYVIQKTNQS